MAFGTSGVTVSFGVGTMGRAELLFGVEWVHVARRMVLTRWCQFGLKFFLVPEGNVSVLTAFNTVCILYIAGFDMFPRLL